eukprot:8936657-Pyramimonas_sp.AAC.1
MATGVSALPSISCGASRSSLELPCAAVGSDAATASNAVNRVDWAWRSVGMASTPTTPEVPRTGASFKPQPSRSHSRRVLGNAFAPRSARLSPPATGSMVMTFLATNCCFQSVLAA